LWDEVVAIVMPMVFKLGEEKNVRFPVPCEDGETNYGRSTVSGKRKLFAHLAWKSIADVTIF
jgi:hypothetical protein